MARRLIFRILMLLLLVASPILFPILLLWSEGRVTRRDLAEMYRTVFRAIRWGFL